MYNTILIEKYNLENYLINLGKIPMFLKVM